MKQGLKGQVLFEVQHTIHEYKLAELTTALDSKSARETALLVPFFGPTIHGEATFVELLGIDLTKALMAGINYSWNRPFKAGELVTVKVSVEDQYEKAGKQFVVVNSESKDLAGDPIQAHQATFVELGTM